jgi:predicted kinase
MAVREPARESFDMADVRSGAIRRLIIVGSPGSGKTTLAARIAEESGLPLYGLSALADRVAHRADAERRLHGAVARVVRGRRWIFEGTLLALRPRPDFDRLLELRLAHAEAIAVLDLPPSLCAARVMLRGRSSDYEGLGDLIRGFRRAVLPRVERAITATARGLRVVVLRTPGAVDRFLAVSRAP